MLKDDATEKENKENMESENNNKNTALKRFLAINVFALIIIRRNYAHM